MKITIRYPFAWLGFLTYDVQLIFVILHDIVEKMITACFDAHQFKILKEPRHWPESEEPHCKISIFFFGEGRNNHGEKGLIRDFSNENLVIYKVVVQLFIKRNRLNTVKLPVESYVVTHVILALAAPLRLAALSKQSLKAISTCRW